MNFFIFYKTLDFMEMKIEIWEFSILDYYL
jgi:hypothetical protein